MRDRRGGLSPAVAALPVLARGAAPAARLLRKSLAREDGGLRLGDDGRPLAAFLARHGGLQSEKRAAPPRPLGEVGDEVGLR